MEIPIPWENLGTVMNDVYKLSKLDKLLDRSNFRTFKSHKYLLIWVVWEDHALFGILVS